MPAKKKAQGINWMTLSFAIALSAVLLAGIIVWQLRDNFLANLSEAALVHPQISLVRVYFSNRLKSAGNGDCNQVFPVGRVVSADKKIEASLEQLFSGPTSKEKSSGFSSIFSDRTQGALKSIRVRDGAVFINLNDIRGIIPKSSSCGSAQLLSAIDTTLRQFPEVQKVRIAINGKPSLFYDWIQVGCTKENDNCDDSPFK